MSPTVEGRKLQTAFATHEFCITLVAYKSQTGFDQPKLAAIFVDRRLRA